MNEIRMEAHETRIAPAVLEQRASAAAEYDVYVGLDGHKDTIAVAPAGRRTPVSGLLCPFFCSPPGLLPRHGSPGVRPTHTAKLQRPRYWRTRKDPFEAVWPTICGWLEDDPDQNGKMLLQRLHVEYPGVFPDGQLRTLQRRLKAWRSQRARSLVFGDQSEENDWASPL